MKKLKNTLIALINPVINLKLFFLGIKRYFNFIRDLQKYRSMKGAEKIKIHQLSPRLHDKTSGAGIDDTSLYQNVWALDLIRKSGISQHIDIGSHTQFIGMLSNILPVTYIELRPFDVDLPNLTFKQGSILELPYEDNSIASLSCLHTIEHIGLGRYGDPLDPEGSVRSIKELQRVIKPGGNLYVSTPVGFPRTNFNAHRVFSPQFIIDEFDQLELVELSGVGANKKFHRNIDPLLLSDNHYGLGLFWFKKTTV
jgi:SAM-dependent methyltransferase